MSLTPQPGQAGIEYLILKICGIALRGVGLKPLRAGGFVLSIILQSMVYKETEKYFAFFAQN